MKYLIPLIRGGCWEGVLSQRSVSKSLLTLTWPGGEKKKETALGVI